MKKITLIILTLVMTFLSAHVTLGEESIYNKRPERLSFAPQKETQIINAARKVAQEIAPKFCSDTLMAVIYSAPYSQRKGVVDVYFMIHENDYVEYQKCRRDSINKQLIIDPVLIRRPHSILTVTIYENSLEPESISDSHSRFLLFEPSYADFRKNNPNKQFEPYLYPAGENIIF